MELASESTVIEKVIEEPAAVAAGLVPGAGIEPAHPCE